MLCECEVTSFYVNVSFDFDRPVTRYCNLTGLANYIFTPEEAASERNLSLIWLKRISKSLTAFRMRNATSPVVRRQEVV